MNIGDNIVINDSIIGEMVVVIVDIIGEIVKFENKVLKYEGICHIELFNNMIMEG